MAHITTGEIILGMKKIDCRAVLPLFLKRSITAMNRAMAIGTIRKKIVHLI